MSLTLYYHPLSSYCWKTLIALYENDTPFEKHLVNLGNEAERAAFQKIWPIGKFPVLRDSDRDWTVPESSIIVEYLDQRFPGKTKFLPSDSDQARQVRMFDRFYDLHIHSHMQRIVAERIRPADKKDPLGLEQARAQLRTALAMVERDMTKKTWAAVDTFGLADCSAAPALWYANHVMPFDATHKNTSAYLKRLTERPSFARVLKEAEPYFSMFPK